MIARILVFGPMGSAAVGLIVWAVYRDRRARVQSAREVLARYAARAMRHREVPHA